MPSLADLSLAVIGPRGLTGEEFLRLLGAAKWARPPTLVTTQNKASGSALFRGKKIPVRALSDILKKRSRFDILVSFAETDWAKTHLNKLSGLASFIVDESSAFRLDPNVPLVVPEINGSLLGANPPKLLASPNCTTSVLVMALAPILALSPIKRVLVASYQAATGGGRKASEAFLEETRCFAKKGWPPKKSAVFPQPLAGNVFPHIGNFDALGFSEEENKVIKEARKILNLPDLDISAICCRVPVLRSHSLAVWVETQNHIRLEALKESFQKFPDVALKEPYPTPLLASGKTSVFVGRLRNDPVFPAGISLWATGDNLLKGAALNVLQIVESLLPAVQNMKKSNAF